MRHMLGVAESDDDKNNGIHVGIVALSNTCDIDRNFRSLYVYCDILKHIAVGDTKAPLLRSVSVTGTHGSVIRGHV